MGQDRNSNVKTCQDLCIEMYAYAVWGVLLMTHFIRRHKGKNVEELGYVILPSMHTHTHRALGFISSTIIVTSLIMKGN